LSRSDIGAALGGDSGRGTRAVAGYDEDPVSMAVGAARSALGRLPVEPQRILFATTSPPYQDKTNANVVHAALALDPTVFAIDMGDSVRSALGAMIFASEAAVPTLAVLSDVRTGLPGGRDEREGGDGACAFLFGDSHPPMAEVLATASITEEFLDRWRVPGSPSSSVWEERFGEHVYLPAAEAAWGDALKEAGLAAADIDVLVVAGTHARAVRTFGAKAGVGRVADDLSASIGNTGAAQAGMLLANVLDTARPGETVALVVLADGASAMILRTTAEVADRRRPLSVSEQIAAGCSPLRYADFLAWRGLLSREPPRRPDPVPPAAPPTYRSAKYKYGFIAHRCEECGTVHLPAVRVCVQCKAVDHMAEVPMSDKLGTITTFTVDHLAYSPSPPVIAAVVDFDGGGRLACELTDADPQHVAIGDRVEMSFRRLVTAGGVHNYFWKARPVLSTGRSSEKEDSR
jgi:3-hydroxy-3-methylglutaryl CoA synthase